MSAAISKRTLEQGYGRSLWLLLVLVLGLLWWGMSLPASGQIFGVSIDPALKWQTLETEHFRIHFHEGLLGPAQEVAIIAEESYKIIEEEFGQAPAKLDIFLLDAFDFSNGFANPFGDQVGIFTSQYRLSDWANVRLDSWWRLVIFHELVHAIELDQTRGISKIARAIFGKAVLPNVMKPIPFIEGLAVYEKYKYLKESRLNDSRTRMMLRQMVLDNKIPRFDEIKGFYSRSEWPPLGQLMYNYGSWLMRYVEEKHGRDALRRFDEANARGPLNLLALFGFGEDLNRVTSEALGLSADELYGGFRAWLREQFSPEIEALRREGITEALRVTTLGFLSGQPAWSPDGEWIVYSHAGPGRAGLRIITPYGEEDHEILPSGSYPAWSPDGRSIIYSKLDFESPYYIQSDLYRSDLATKREERLTRGERAYYAKFSPDGGKIFYAKNIGRDGSTALAVLDLKTQKTQIIKEFPDNTGVIHSFAISPDGGRIALALWRRGGFQDLYLMPSSGGELTPLTQDRNQDADPAWSPDGKYILFSSDPNRVYNLYAYRLEDGQFFQITNMMSGAFYPTLSPDGQQMAFVSYSGQGFNIYKLPYDPPSWKSVEFPKEAIPTWAGYPTTPYAVRPYNPWPLLAPKFWLPFPAPEGLGLVTAAFDPLFKHSYSVVAGWDFQASRPFYSLTYQNNESLPVVLFAGEASSGSRYGLRASIPLALSTTRQQFLSVGYERQRQRPKGGEDSSSGAKQIVSGSYSFTQTRRQDLFGDSVRIRVSGELSHVEGSGRWHKKLVLDWQESFRLPLIARHALVLRATAGWTDSDVEDARFKLGGPYGRFVLRGFPDAAMRGKQAVSAGLTYEFPLFSIERGMGHWPLFLDDVRLGLFVDAGMAGDQLNLQDLRVGFGLEGRLSLTLGYSMPFELIAGIAQGVAERQPRFYVNASLPELF